MPRARFITDWQARQWQRGLFALLLTLLLMVPLFMLLATLTYFDISGSTEVGILVGYLVMNIKLAVLLKNGAMLFNTAFMLLMPAFIMALQSQP